MGHGSERQRQSQGLGLPLLGPGRVSRQQALQQLNGPRTLQASLNLPPQFHSPVHRPCRQQPGMNQDILPFAMNQWPASKPGEQFLAVLGRQYRAQVGVLQGGANSQAACQQLQVMVSENADGSIAKLSDPAKDLQGHRSTVDQVPYQPEAVPAGVEPDGFHQMLQGPEASVNVADRESGHGMEAILKQWRRSDGAGKSCHPPGEKCRSSSKVRKWRKLRPASAPFAAARKGRRQT